MARRTILAHDVFVRPRSPLRWAAASLLTGGLVGARAHHLASDELRRYGRPRGRMPFPFLTVSPGASTTAWLLGLLCWYIVALSVVGYAVGLADGYEPSAGDVTAVASLVLLLAPMWLVTAHTLRRVRTAQHLAGVEGPWPNPTRGAILASLLPPLGTWIVQRQLNRVWRAYS